MSNPWGSCITGAWGLRALPKKQICWNDTVSFGKFRDVWQTEAPHTIFPFYKEENNYVLSLEVSWASMFQVLVLAKNTVFIHKKNMKIVGEMEL